MNKETKLIIHNITAKAVLKFGSEAWVLKKREEQLLDAAKMKFLRHLLGITKLDKEKYQCIGGKTGAQNIVKGIKQYHKKWLQHVQRMDRNRMTRQALQYRPKGRRNIGRPRKRLRDQLHFEDQGTGNMPNRSWTWWWCVYPRTNSDLCHLQHKLIGFYNRDENRLQRGTDWVFK